MDLENDKIYNYKVKIEVKDVVLVLNDKIVNENEDIRIQDKLIHEPYVLDHDNQDELQVDVVEIHIYVYNKRNYIQDIEENVYKVVQVIIYEGVMN